jgi:hypothetical protein
LQFTFQLFLEVIYTYWHEKGSLDRHISCIGP